MAGSEALVGGRRGVESGTGARSSLGGAPSEGEAAGAAQRRQLPGKSELSLRLLRPQQAPPWGLRRDSSVRVLWPGLTPLFLCLNLGKNPSM